MKNFLLSAIIAIMITTMSICDCVLLFKYHDEQQHVEYLRSYIQEMQLPVPAYPPRDK